MSASGGSQTLIGLAQVQKQSRLADGIVSGIKWVPKTAAAAPGDLHRSRLLQAAGTAEKVSLFEVFKAVRPQDSLLNESEYRAYYTVRYGLQIAFAVLDEYKVIVGIDGQQNLLAMTSDQKAALQEKSRTAAAIVLQTLASYVVHVISPVTESNAVAEHVSVSEVVLEDPIQALNCTLYYLTKNIAHPSVNNDAAVLGTVKVYFAKLLDEIEQRKDTFKHLDAFAKIAFGIEGTDFTVTGLDRHEAGATSTAFNRVSPEQVVGNQDAKHFVRRVVQRMLAYNRKEQRNVFTELGGLAPVWMGYGPPGTGKSMVIGMTATELQDGCDRIGLPFLFHPLPDNIIDSYQGNSAKNMVAWMKTAQDPTKIVFMPIDDAENILEERTRQGVSEGVRAAIGVFLRYTEGAYAINRGNATIGVFTNLPEQIDAAVRSRIQARMVMNGAVTVEDALDQDYLWMRKFASQEGFMNLIPPAYKYMSAQQELRTMADAVQTRDVPSHATAAEIYNDVAKNIDPMHHEFIATLYMRFKDRFKNFTSRDMRNIQSAVDQRVMDFDLPDEWFETPEAFSLLEYDRQKTMVLDLRDQNMKGLRFADIYRQEVIRYLDNYATIADAQFDRDVEARLEQWRVQEAVEKRARVK